MAIALCAVAIFFTFLTICGILKVGVCRDIVVPVVYYEKRFV